MLGNHENHDDEDADDLAMLTLAGLNLLSSAQGWDLKGRDDDDDGWDGETFENNNQAGAGEEKGG